jgi:hypothetical protein
VLAKQSRGGRSRACVRGRRGGWAGGCRASGRRAAPVGRTPSAGSAAPASSAACRRSPLPQRNLFFFWICAFPVALRPLPLLSPLPTAARPPEVRAQQLATGGENDAETGERVCAVRAAGGGTERQAGSRWVGVAQFGKVRL